MHDNDDRSLYNTFWIVFIRCWSVWELPGVCWVLTVDSENMNTTFTDITLPGTHEDSMYGTKLETIRSIHSEVWHNVDKNVTSQFKNNFPFWTNFLVYFISNFPSNLFQPFGCICLVALQLQTLDGKNSCADKKDDHAT